MSSPIAGKVVLVTGASRGIGLELVKQLLAKGNHVISAARSPKSAEALNQLAQQLPPVAANGGSATHPQLTLVQLDVANPESIEAAVQELAALLSSQAIDVVINNAGIAVEKKSFGEVTAEDFTTTFQTNTIGPFLFTQALYNAGLIGKEGSTTVVVNVSSILGSVGTSEINVPSYFSYRTSKAALNMLSKYTGVALSDKGVASVAIHPGYVATDMNKEGGVISPTESVQGMLNVLEDGRELQGRFYSYDGSELPW